MALIKISQLPPGDSDLSPSDVVPFVDAETLTTKKVSIQGLSDYFNVRGIVDSALAITTLHDSALTQGQIDSSLASYQFDYFEYDSAVVQGQIDSSLAGYNFFDSDQMQSMIDSSMDSVLSDLGMDASPTSGSSNDF